MHSARILLLFASTCLVQAQSSASRAASQQPSSIRQDILPTLTTASNSVPFSTILQPFIPNHRKLASPRDFTLDCEAYLYVQHYYFRRLQSLSYDAPTPPFWSRVFSPRDKIMNGTRLVGAQSISTYDPQDCVFGCYNTPGCLSFNIYIEATSVFTDPSLCPQINTTVKCTYWGEDLDKSMATVSSQRGLPNPVRYAGSNAYHRGLPFESDEEQAEEYENSDGELVEYKGVSTRLTGFTAGSMMGLLVLGVMAESWF